MPRRDTNIRSALKILIELGIISDTHGLLREEAIEALAGVDMIIHAGDIGKADVINALSDIAPVHAIRGNIDKQDWAQEYPDTLSLIIAQRRFHIIHNIKQLDLSKASSDFDVVVSGHSHQPAISHDSGLLLINRGSAGPRRFRLPICLAKLSLSDDTLNPRIINLI